MEFSDQDDFSNIEGPHEIRVKPPPGFKDDLGLLGGKFNLDQNSNNNDQQTEIQSSLGQFNAASLNPFANLLANQQSQSSTATPNLPSFNPLAGLTQEQIQQLALLQYLQNNPVLGFGFGLGGAQGPQVTLQHFKITQFSIKITIFNLFMLFSRLSHLANQFTKPKPCMLQALFHYFWEPRNSSPL